MKEFFNYFFGQGDSVEFTSFSLAHLLPILFGVGVVYLIFRFRNELASSKDEAKIRLTLALIMIITEMSYFWRLVGIPELGANPVDHLPITLCGWSIIFGSYMLVSKSQSLFDITYFWVFAGTIFALITPTVITYTGPTRFRFYQFWLEHLLGYFAVFYMIFVHKLRPTLKSAVRSYVFLSALALVAFFANTVIGPGANYLFMAKPESTPSILDILPPNFALRIIVMGAVVTTLFFLAYLPWLIMDKRNEAKPSEANEEEKITV